jgi:hypothetical protein
MATIASIMKRFIARMSSGSAVFMLLEDVSAENYSGAGINSPALAVCQRLAPATDATERPAFKRIRAGSRLTA